MTNLFNRGRLLLAVILLLLFTMGGRLHAQQAPLTKPLDSFYIVKEPARRIEIYNASLKQWPDTGMIKIMYNSARSLIAKEYAQANNLAEAQKWMSLIDETGPENRFSLKPRSKLEVAAVMIEKGDTAYGVSQLQPWADSLYKELTTTGKPGIYYNIVMVVYTPVLMNRNQHAQVVKYLTPFYEWSKNSFATDRESVMRTPKDKYDLRTNLAVQYARSLSLTGDTKAAIQVLSNMQASGLYNQEDLARIIDGYSGKVKKNYASKVLDSLKKSNLDRLAKFQQYKQDIDGNKIDLKATHAKYVLLDFWGSWCHPCRASHPHLKELYAEYKDKGFEIIGIAQEMTKDTAQLYNNWVTAIKEDGLTWRQVLNNKNGKQFDAVTEFGITAFPTKILLDSEGNIVATFIGNSGRNDLGDKLHELLDAKK
jgi:thiol-disulfide isomerase/thioredoxin